jgi:hypothetical protein
MHPNEHFSVLDAGAGSGNMAGALICHFRNVKVVALDHRAIHLRTLLHRRSWRMRVTFPSQSMPFRPLLVGAASFFRSRSDRYDLDAAPIREPRIALAATADSAFVTTPFSYTSQGTVL